MIGVMQGRLLPKYEGRYQAHPVDYWEAEYEIAAELGLDCIEFIVDYNDIERNPFFRPGGIDEIIKVSEASGVVTRTICADYLMIAPLHGDNESLSQRSKKLLLQLIKKGNEIGISEIVIPCVDGASIKQPESRERFVSRLPALVELAEKLTVNLCLETDLSPDEFGALLQLLNSKCITVNYDIGNSAALGYDPREEFESYGESISDLHIKDRVLGGGPVFLGTGDANFGVVFDQLKKINYDGPSIMQAYRDDEGLEIFSQQLEFIKPFIDDLYNSEH
jgi:hexulose-6-phosphate isomerase